MRYWLLRRPLHNTETHSRLTNTLCDYDKVFVDVRLKPGDILYLTGADDELYGWGYVLKRESYREQDTQIRVYRVTAAQSVVEQNLVRAAELKQHSDMRELFADSNRNLISLKAVHVNAFNELLRSKAAPAPTDINSDEPETDRVAKEDFPRIPLTPHIVTWLNSAYVQLRQGKQIKPTEMLVQLWASLPEDFDYNTIDRRLIRHGVDLTLLGILHIDPATDLVEKTDHVIRFIQELIRQQPGIETVTSEQISEDLSIPEDDVALIFGLMDHLGDFWNGGSGYGHKPGYYSVTIRDEKVKREYLKYKDIDESLKMLASHELNEKHVIAAATPTEPSNREFDVCLSFAGEDRQYVERVATALHNAGVSLFYDAYEQVSLWGKNLYQHLDDVYRVRATHCVVFISHAYSEKFWTKHELRSAQARAFKENREYILPVRLDDTQLPGVLPTTGYVSNKSPEDLAELIIEKLNQAPGFLSKAETTDSGVIHQTMLMTQQAEPNGPSILVLPFRNESGDLDNHVFCNGLTVELVNTLSKIEGLEVSPLSSSFFFENKDVDISEVRSKLQVCWVLEGSVRKVQNDLRITAHLVNTNDGCIRKSGFSSGSTLDHIFDTQIKIATDIVEALQVKLSIAARPSVFKRDIVNPEAYECYMNGQYFFYQHARDGWLKAIEFFEKATSIEPEYASAYARLASVLAFAWFYGAMHPDEAIDKWRNTNERALKLGSELAETHIAVGRFRFLYERNWETAEQEYKRAAEINPENADAYQQYGLLLAARGYVEEAIREARRALRCEPYSLLVNFHAAAIYWLCGEWDMALSQVDHAIYLFPSSNSAYWIKGLIYSMTGEHEKAIESYLKSIELRDDNHARSSLAFTYGLSGQKNEALRIVDTLIERNKQRYDTNQKAPYASAYNVAVAYGGLRESDEAFTWLKRAYRERNGDLVYLKVHSTIGGEGLWGKELPDDQRFQELLQLVGFK
jgi:adenylate cyclase